MQEPNDMLDNKGAVLILGAGNFQIDAIEHCKRAGYRVLGCSYRDIDPGIPLLDAFRQVDIRDIEGVIAFAREEGAIAVYSVGSDIAIPTAIAASERLGLPHFISYETACVCQDKGKMRAILADSGWSVPFTVARDAREAAEFGQFPAMMKPVDSQGQRGCFRVDSPEDVERLFEKSSAHSNTGDVIIERFIDGPEVSVNAFLRDGKIEFFMPSDRFSYSEYPGGIIKEHGLPCRSLEEDGLERVRQLVEQVTQRIGIKDGPVYFQIKLEGQQPYVIEVTPRLDGCHMWRFIRHYCGYDLLAATFQLLLGEDAPAQPAPQPREGDWRLQFLNSEPGVSFDRANYDVEGSDFLLWYYETGDTVLPINGFMEKCGYRIFRLA